MRRNKFLTEAVSGALALCFLIGMDWYHTVGTNGSGTGNIGRVLLFALAWLLLRLPIQPMTDEDRRIRKLARSWSILFCTALVIGSAVYQDNAITPLLKDLSRLLRLTVIWIGFTVVGERLTWYAMRYLKCHSRDLMSRSKQWPLFQWKGFFFLVWGSVFLSWIPALMAYWPGLSCYDIAMQVSEVLEGTYTTRNPVLHTWIWGLFMKLENLTGIRAVTLYDLIQMALLSCVLAVTLRRMASRGCCNGLILGGWLFVLLNPVIAVFSLETAKDVYLGIFFCRSPYC